MNTKGGSVVSLRNFLKTAKVEDDFINHLSTEEQKYYRTVLPISWVPINIMARFYETATQLLYPDDLRGLVRLGGDIMRSDIKGIYKFLVRFATVPYLVNQAATIFSTYFDTGSVRVVNPPDKKNYLELFLENHEFPMAFRQTVEGTLIALLEMAGCQMVNVNTDFTSRESWKFIITWK